MFFKVAFNNMNKASEELIKYICIFNHLLEKNSDLVNTRHVCA